MVDLPDWPEHIHEIQSSGQITIPKDIRDQFDSEKFVVFTSEDDGTQMIHLYPTEQ